MFIYLKSGQFGYYGQLRGEIIAIERQVKPKFLGHSKQEWRMTVRLCTGSYAFLYYERKKIDGQDVYIWLKED
jgi:hypothetical protein